MARHARSSGTWASTSRLLANAEAAEDPIEDLVVSYLGRKACLLVLDNCEHMIDACAELVDRVMTTCPNVAILATEKVEKRADVAEAVPGDDAN